MDTLNFISMLFQTFVALALVCGLAYLVFRVIMPKLNVNYTSNSMIRVVDRIGLDARKSLYIIEVAEQYMLIAVSENGVQMVSELNSDSAKLAEEELAKVRSNQSGASIGSAFSEKLSQIIKKNQGDK